MFGFVHNKDEIEIADINENENIEYNSWKKIDSLPPEINLPFTTKIYEKMTSDFQIIDNTLCLVEYIPVLGKNYNPATQKMEPKQVGMGVVIQKLDKNFVSKMAELSGTKIEIYACRFPTVCDVSCQYQKLGIDISEKQPGNQDLNSQSLIFSDTEFNGKKYYGAVLPIYSNSKNIAAIAAFYSKSNFHAATLKIIKLISLVYLLGIIIVVPTTIFIVIRTIINPIKNISNMMRKIAREKDFNTMLEVSRNDEIGDLAASFNEMIANLRQSTTSIDKLNAEIAERKRAEEKMRLLNEDLENANNELKNFAYVASHDLREPLRKITSFGSLLENSIKNKLEPDDAENLHFMIDGAKRMNQMIDGLLSYSRASANEPHLENVELDKIIDDLQKFELDLLLKETHTIINILKPLPVIRADSVQIRQLLQNLIANGIKYQKKGNIPQITITSRPAENGMVRIEIADNGIGIPPEYQQAVFTMFKRLHSRTEYEGTGIGLAVCKKIVHRHKGQIGVESQPGKGSTFWFTVPLANVAQEYEVHTIVGEHT